MHLTVKKINGEQYVRTVTDKSGSVIWQSKPQYYIYLNEVVMTREQMTALIEQMKKLPSFNIVSVENEFDYD